MLSISTNQMEKVIYARLRTALSHAQGILLGHGTQCIRRLGAFHGHGRDPRNKIAKINVHEGTYILVLRATSAVQYIYIQSSRDLLSQPVLLVTVEQGPTMYAINTN